MFLWVILLAAIVCRDPADFDHNIAPFLALRAAQQDDLSVHERYQDAVRQYGIEGHLKAMGEEYQALAAQHPGELMYRYLVARALVGRGTPSAIQSLTAIAEEHPDFAPAHRTLSEIATLVPPPPEPSLLLDRAEQLFRENADSEQAAQMAAAAIRADEWRLQRIRAFDWYSPELKRENLRAMQSEYWKLWDLQVRCWRKNGQLQKAQDLLAEMRRRAALLADPDRLAQVDRLGK